jgi:hypothetical protein
MSYSKDGGPAGSGGRLARKTSRIGQVLCGLGAFVTAIAVAGCAAPQFTYVTDGNDNTYFKVPYGWHKIDDKSLAQQLKSPGSVFGQGNGTWDIAYDAAGAPAAGHLFSPSTTQPFAFAFVAPLSAAGSNGMSYNGLRDVMLPVTPTARQVAAKSRFPLTGFHLLRDTVLTPSGGVHGVWDTFDYTYPGGLTDTFDQVALTNADNTQLYVLVMHCLASCYSQNRNEFNTIMSSFTVRSP